MSASADDPVADLPTRWLDCAVVGMSAFAVVGLVALDTPPLPLSSACAALALLVATWFVLRRRALDGGPGWPVVLAALLLACAVGALASPAFATFQAIAFPLAWLLTPGRRSALVANLAVALAVGVGYALRSSVLEAVVVQGISLGFSLAIGLWISRISARSAGRQVLIERLTAAQEQVAALSREAGTLAERQRLARELHDTLTQSLTGVVMLAERARSRHPGDAGLDVLEEAARQALGEARALVAAGAGVPLEGGLAAALTELAERFRRETGLEVRVDAEAAVPRGLEVVLLRCAQEGLANVRKHAGARAVEVRLVPVGDDAVLTVADDGRGPGDGGGFGLAGMRDRLAIVGGRVALEPGEQRGAVLTVRVPLTEEVPA